MLVPARATRGREITEIKNFKIYIIIDSRFQSGSYLCIAKNGVPPVVSKRVQLYVDFPPTLWITHQLVGVELGGSATIECLTAAHPKSLNFWHDKFGQFISQKWVFRVCLVFEFSFI